VDGERQDVSGKALANFARRIGLFEFSLADVTRERVRPHRDMTGLTPDQMRQVLGMPGRRTVRGRRDYAILALLWENALRRGEVAKLDVGDFDPHPGHPEQGMRNPAGIHPHKREKWLAQLPSGWRCAVRSDWRTPCSSPLMVEITVTGSPARASGR